MTFLDSSAIIDYLRDDDRAVAYLDGREPFFTSTVCVFEVIDGKLGSGSTDVAGIRNEFGGVQAIGLSENIAVEAARLQDAVMSDGGRLSHRDAMVAATARSTGGEFVVSDADFEVGPIEDVVEVTNLRT